MQFPGGNLIGDPIIDLHYEIEIDAEPADIWPWIIQMGYHRGGWYIDTWWDEAIQKHFWPRVVPEEARGSFKPPASDIMPEYQALGVGHIIPDGPANTAYYKVVDIQPEKLLLLYSTSHFKYAAPQFVYNTPLAPRGAFCWAFVLDPISSKKTRLISWWQAEIHPKTFFFLIKPIFCFIDGLHQREILKGIKRRVENQPS